MSWRELLRSVGLTRGRAPRPACRLTEEQAREIALQALGRPVPLVVHQVMETPAGVEWEIGTATVGSGTIITIRDADGAVTGRRQWGVR